MNQWAFYSIFWITFFAAMLVIDYNKSQVEIAKYKCTEARENNGYK